MRGFLKVALLSSVFAVSSYAAEAETLKLGVLATLSGAGTAWGIAMQGAAELAAEDVNSKGGLEVGGKKYQVEVIAYDDHYKAADALTAFNRLVFDDGVKYVVGPLGSAPALAFALSPAATRPRRRTWPKRTARSRVARAFASSVAVPVRCMPRSGCIPRGRIQPR